MTTVLLVDDSNISRRIMRHYLESTTAEIYEAANGLEALAMYRTHNPDMVFLDMTMPGMQGMEVLAKLRQINPQAKVIITTADIQHSTRKMAEEAGASGFIYKPLEKNAVLSAYQAQSAAS